MNISRVDNLPPAFSDNCRVGTGGNGKPLAKRGKKIIEVDQTVLVISCNHRTLVRLKAAILAPCTVFY